MNNLYIRWDDEYNLGIPIIDEQHRAIVSTINTYHYFMINEKSGCALKPTFITLDQYTTTHFMTEESIFQQTEYPGQESHKELHDDLKKRMREIATEAIKKNDFDIVLNFLKNWWLTHIRVEDAKYAPYVTEKLKSI